MNEARWLLLATLLLVAGRASAAGQAHALLWRIDGPDGQHGWLFGSLHFGVAGLYPLPVAVTRAFAQAGVLAVEINLLAQDQARAGQLLLERGFYARPGDDLQHHLSAAGWRQLAAAAGQLGLPLADLQRQRPWLAALTLSSQLFQNAGYSSELGIDLHFLQAAHQRAMAIVELESLQQQLDLLVQLPADEQNALLRQTLTDVGQGNRYVEQIVRAWREGDIATLDKLLNPPPDPVSRRLYRALLNQRNSRMTTAIEGLLTAGRTPFVVVGAGHLVAADSIVQQLRQHGYQVVQR